MATIASGIGPALIAVFFYAIPAASIRLLVGGLADPRRERWEAPPLALALKQRYRKGAVVGRYVNLFLAGVFLVQILAHLLLRANDCDADATHTNAAAANLAIVADRVFAVGIFVLALLAVAALAWSGVYLARARTAGWQDPRRHDPLIVHLVMVPFAVMLLFVAFSVVPRTFCGG